MDEERQKLLDENAKLRDDADRNRRFAGWMALFIVASTFGSTTLMLLMFMRFGVEPSAFMASLATVIIQNTFWISGIAAHYAFKTPGFSSAQPGSEIYAGPERRVFPRKSEKE